MPKQFIDELEYLLVSPIYKTSNGYGNRHSKSMLPIYRCMSVKVFSSTRNWGQHWALILISLLLHGKQLNNNFPWGRNEVVGVVKQSIMQIVEITQRAVTPWSAPWSCSESGKSPVKVNSPASHNTSPFLTVTQQPTEGQAKSQQVYASNRLIKGYLPKGRIPSCKELSWTGYYKSIIWSQIGTEIEYSLPIWF